MNDGLVAAAQTWALDREPALEKIGDGALVADVDVLAKMVGGNGSAVEFDDGELAGLSVLDPVEAAEAVEAGEGADVGGDFFEAGVAEILPDAGRPESTGPGSGGVGAGVAHKPAAAIEGVGFADGAVNHLLNDDGAGVGEFLVNGQDVGVVRDQNDARAGTIDVAFEEQGELKLVGGRSGVGGGAADAHGWDGDAGGDGGLHERGLAEDHIGALEGIDGEDLREPFFLAAKNAGLKRRFIAENNPWQDGAILEEEIAERPGGGGGIDRAGDHALDEPGSASRGMRIAQKGDAAAGVIEQRGDAGQTETIFQGDEHDLAAIAPLLVTLPRRHISVFGWWQDAFEIAMDDRSRMNQRGIPMGNLLDLSG